MQKRPLKIRDNMRLNLLPVAAFPRRRLHLPGGDIMQPVQHPLRHVRLAALRHSEPVPAPVQELLPPVHRLPRSRPGELAAIPLASLPAEIRHSHPLPRTATPSTPLVNRAFALYPPGHAGVSSRLLACRARMRLRLA